jgi:hypothetical protein
VLAAIVQWSGLARLNPGLAGRAVYINVKAAIKVMESHSFDNQAV